jgi:hypothetical protein
MCPQIIQELGFLRIELQSKNGKEILLETQLSYTQRTQVIISTQSVKKTKIIIMHINIPTLQIYFVHNLTTHNTRRKEASTPPAGFKPAIPSSERPQTQALDSAATEIFPL